MCSTKIGALKVAGLACNFIKKETLAQVFSSKFWKIFKNTYFTELLWTTHYRFWNPLNLHEIIQTWTLPNIYVTELFVKTVLFCKKFPSVTAYWMLCNTPERSENYQFLVVSNTANLFFKSSLWKRLGSLLMEYSFVMKIESEPNCGSKNLIAIFWRFKKNLIPENREQKSISILWFTA